MRTNTKRWLQKASIIKMAPVIALAGVPYFAAGQEGMKLEEVLVTATRRTQTDAQSTPVALTQISSEQIQKMAPRDLRNIAALAPNVAAGKQPGFNSANFAIRGVGQNGIIVYYENQVGVTVDDFVIPHIQTANIEMLDIEAIEILRGPQGTLFGKNTTGGVINVKTNKPQLDAVTLAETVSQVLNGEVKILDAGFVQTMRGVYENKDNNEPPEEEDVAREQLSALLHIMK